jgi:RNA polymerase sigma-70 factor (ECF subfamily)
MRMNWLRCAADTAPDAALPPRQFLRPAAPVFRNGEACMTRGSGETVRTAAAARNAGGEAGDGTLLAAAAEGEHAAFRSLVSRYADRVFANCQRILADRAEAEDAVQESFARLWRVLDGGGASAPDRDAGGWLMRTSRNLCIDRLRRRKRWVADEGGLDRQLDPDPGAEARLQEQDVGARLSAALDRLPDRQRAAIALVHFDGLPQTEAAAAMDVSVEALESLLARGRRALRDRLKARKEDLL